jgi:hypothetical protein
MTRSLGLLKKAPQIRRPDWEKNTLESRANFLSHCRLTVKKPKTWAGKKKPPSQRELEKLDMKAYIDTLEDQLEHIDTFYEPGDKMHDEDMARISRDKWQAEMQSMGAELPRMKLARVNWDNYEPDLKGDTEPGKKHSRFKFTCPYCFKDYPMGQQGKHQRRCDKWERSFIHPYFHHPVRPDQLPFVDPTPQHDKPDMVWEPAEPNNSFCLCGAEIVNPSEEYCPPCRRRLDWKPCIRPRTNNLPLRRNQPAFLCCPKCGGDIFTFDDCYFKTVVRRCQKKKCDWSVSVKYS